MTSVTACTPEEFYTEKVLKLEERQRTLQDLLENAKRNVEAEEKCLSQWTECLKKRKKMKETVQKEMNSAFIPCFVKKKAQEFHNCLKCCRKTNACVLWKKQKKAMAEGAMKLIENQLVLVNDDLKSAENFWITLKSIDVEKKDADGKIKESKLIDKAKALIYSIDKRKYSNSDYELKELTAMQIFEKKDIEQYMQAKKRIHEDFFLEDRSLMCEEKINLVQLAIKRCRVLRDYDQNADELLKVIESKLTSGKKKLKEYELMFNIKFKEYQEYVSNACDDKKGYYKTVMDHFANIAKSPELTRSQRKCINMEKDKCNSLELENECYDKWNRINDRRVKLQIEQINCIETAMRNSSNICCTDEQKNKRTNDTLVDLICLMTAAEEKYGRETEHGASFADCLDNLEASLPDYTWKNVEEYEEARFLLYKILLIENKKRSMENALHSWVSAFLNNDNHEHFDRFMQHAYELLKWHIDYAVKEKDAKDKEDDTAKRIRVSIRGESNTFMSHNLYRIIPELMKKQSLVTSSDLYNLSFNFSETDEVALACTMDPCTQKELPPCLLQNKNCSTADREYPCVNNPDCVKMGAETESDSSPSPVQQRAQVQQCVGSSSAQQSSCGCDCE